MAYAAPQTISYAAQPAAYQPAENTTGLVYDTNALYQQPAYQFTPQAAPAAEYAVQPAQYAMPTAPSMVAYQGIPQAPSMIAYAPVQPAAESVHEPPAAAPAPAVSSQPMRKLRRRLPRRRKRSLRRRVDAART